jgi:hypothetical protein
MNVVLLLGWVFSSWAAENEYAGVPLTRLPTLGLGAPVFIDGADQWKASVEGGFVTMMIESTPAEGQGRFRFQRATVGAALPALSLAGANEAAGDDGLVLARAGNIVVLVRGESAVERASAVLASLSPAASTPPPAPANEVSISEVVATPWSDAVEARDGFGRRIR